MKTDTNIKQWFVIKTKPHKELFAKSNFERQNIDVYLPVVPKIIKHARKKQHVLKPFFPGYLFVHLSPDEQRWETISSTRGATGPVSFGESIPPVADWVIESLRTLEDERNILQPGKILEKKLVAGSKVSVILSNHKEIEGIFKCFDGNDRAVVLLELLSRQVKTVVSCSNILG